MTDRVPMASLAAEVADTFARLARSGVLAETRDGQLAMAAAVAEAITSPRHLLVRAGTGVGKTWAYLIPVVLSGHRAVIATATRSLQEQIAARELPRLRAALGIDFSWSVLKGRSNYLCLQRLREAGPDAVPAAAQPEYQQVVEWAGQTVTGDRDELAFEPSEPVWRLLSVRPDECPGKDRCPAGSACFAEQARDGAAVSDLVITNHHVYAAATFASHQLLPEHRVAIFDEAHQLDESFRQATATYIDPARIKRLAAYGGHDTNASDTEFAQVLARLHACLAPHVGAFLGPVPDDISEALGPAGEHVRRLASRYRALAKQDDGQRWQRSAHTLGLVAENIALTLTDPARSVWVEGSANRPLLRSLAATVDTTTAFGDPARRTVVLTSATVTDDVIGELGISTAAPRNLDVASPFDYAGQAMFYCAAGLPEPGSPERSAAVHAELVALISAAGGRTLSLFTSWRALNVAAATVAPLLDVEVLVQGSVGKRELLRRLSTEPTSCVFGTVGLAQGIDIPGDALTLVTLDRIPFPPTNDPYLAARRAAKGAQAFHQVDLRHARTMLAQAAGRLIRTRTDRGVFAVLDPRLATASYRWDLVNAVPPMRRSRDQGTVCEFLRDCARPTPVPD
jgi:ATP-dependent DNA helicase DinG